MILPGRQRIVWKALLQLGPGPLALYALYRLRLRTGYYRKIDGRLLGEAASISRVRPVLPLPKRAALVAAIGKSGLADLTRTADEVVRGRVRLFGAKPLPLLLSLKTKSRHWADYETQQAELPALRFGNAEVDDIKYLWEPARFGWAFTLGRAYHLTGNDKYARAFWKFFERFSRGNRPYLGCNWINGQEVAIRLMSLVWCGQVFANARASSPKRQDRLAQAIAQHAARIPPTLIYARSQTNNHLITEAAALYTAGAALDRSQWRELGWRWLNRGLQQQIGSSGEYIQHSTNYHRLMLQVALWADAIRRGRGEAWPTATLSALRRASHWMFSMLDPVTGRTPNLGANDGALILPLSAAAFEDYRPTVQAAARAFLHTGLLAGPWDEFPLWLGLAPSAHTADASAYAADHLRGKNSWAYLRASTFKSRLGHMDQLHLDLWWRGINVARDAGTYLYNSEPPWDNPLVLSRVHNTVTVDGCEQMNRGGRFLTLDWFPAYCKSVIAADHKVLGRMVAYHDGYRHLGVRHERQASVFVDGHWQIVDDLIFTKPGVHSCRLHWLLPDWTWKIEKDGARFVLALKSPHGWIRLSVRTDVPEASLGAASSIVRAGRVVHGKRSAFPFEGWSSPTYGRKLPALSLAVEVSSNRSFSFVSELVFPK